MTGGLGPGRHPTPARLRSGQGPGGHGATPGPPGHARAAPWSGTEGRRARASYGPCRGTGSGRGPAQSSGQRPPRPASAPSSAGGQVDVDVGIRIDGTGVDSDHGTQRHRQPGSSIQRPDLRWEPGHDGEQGPPAPSHTVGHAPRPVSVLCPGGHLPLNLVCAPARPWKGPRATGEPRTAAPAPPCGGTPRLPPQPSVSGRSPVACVRAHPRPSRAAAAWGRLPSRGARPAARRACLHAA